MTGLKYDVGKTRFDLLDPVFIKAMAEVMTYGAAKYAPNNWQNVEDFTPRYTAALYRHLNKWHQGYSRDDESGLPLLAQVAVNAMFLFHKELHEDTDIQRCTSDCVEVNSIPGADSPDSSGPDDEEEYRAGAELSADIATILDKGWPYKYTRACIVDLCYGRIIKSILSANYTPSNW